uniref:Uncharacterized protein n=1 Tax=Chromera velia CCMP2878 TaxID=1169474 RepID=A0A0G4HL98_9ALVE|eukprot:Cvel_28673.t1-p1 / transcript=Cvel_28673.t1 / gene=Cvel_28673 / organism=Chromera_velia_CCMP2878 / gene_product=hypothetical protein / transcript_product=hypothetical protein / location=Cvel_scaffold3799:11089-12570(-) / protein_length=317 / sequence_SO=supercontig / SO=protein_coding / is_pseudo=false
MAQLVNFDKNADGVEVGLISLTNGQTTQWYAKEVCDYYQDWFSPVQKPLGWTLDVLVICGHGREGSDKIATDDGQRIILEEVAAEIQRNGIRTRRVILNSCQAGDGGSNPSTSMANKLSMLLGGVKTYGPVESIQRFDPKGRFYFQAKYHWNRYAMGSMQPLGEMTLQDLLDHVMNETDQAEPRRPRRKPQDESSHRIPQHRGSGRPQRSLQGPGMVISGMPSLIQHSHCGNGGMALPPVQQFGQGTIPLHALPVHPQGAIALHHQPMVMPHSQGAISVHHSPVVTMLPAHHQVYAQMPTPQGTQGPPLHHQHHLRR